MGGRLGSDEVGLDGRFHCFLQTGIIGFRHFGQGSLTSLVQKPNISIADLMPTGLPSTYKPLMKVIGLKVEFSGFYEIFSQGSPDHS